MKPVQYDVILCEAIHYRTVPLRGGGYLDTEHWLVTEW